MPTRAAVMTGQGAGAIATIQLLGDSAEDILRVAFRRAGGGPIELTPGRILLGEVIEGEQTIDQVTVGCEGRGTFAIHCHGNPLIVERIMGLLQRHAVQPVRGEQLLEQMLSGREKQDSIGIEAKLVLTTVKTVDGARIIANQVKAGLAERAKQWQANLDSIPLDQIAAEAKQILADSDTARLIVAGCTIALIGASNTGKSTLLNTLAGRERAIVTEIRGTTRDWVGAEIHMPPLAVTLIDTAGLDSTVREGIDKDAQDKSMQVLERADVVLLVLDITQPAGQLDQGSIDNLEGKRVLTVLNKSDLPGALDRGSLPASLRHSVNISAKQGTGIDELVRAIHQVCGLTAFDCLAPVTFTDRQRKGLERLQRAASVTDAAAIVAELIHGPLVV